MQKLFNQCPSCGGQLVITECKCPACQLQMRGEFQLGQLSSLSDEALTFIKVFLSVRGNLTEVEAKPPDVMRYFVRVKPDALDAFISNNKLDEINNALNRTDAADELRLKKLNSPPEIKPVSAEETRKDILQQVADGRLSPAEAVQKLREVQG